MARRQLLQRLARRMAANDEITVVLDDAQAPGSDDRPVPVPALGTPVDLPVPIGMDVEEYRACLATLADRVCRSLSRTHHADHVALWRYEGAGFSMVGASGLRSMWRDHVIPRHHGAVRIAMLGDGILVEDAQSRDSHVRDLPGHNTPTYGLAILREGPLVDLITAAGDNLDDSAMFAMAQVAAEEAALWERARRREHLEALIGDD